MLSTLLFPLAFNKVSTHIQEVSLKRYQQQTSSTRQTIILQTSSKDNTSTIRWRKELYVPALFSTHRSGVFIEYCRIGLTRVIVAKVK